MQHAKAITPNCSSFAQCGLWQIVMEDFSMQMHMNLQHFANGTCVMMHLRIHLSLGKLVLEALQPSKGSQAQLERISICNHARWTACSWSTAMMSKMLPGSDTLQSRLYGSSSSSMCVDVNTIETLRLTLSCPTSAHGTLGLQDLNQPPASWSVAPAHWFIDMHYGG